MSKGLQTFTQRDLARAFRAAKQAGVEVRVEISRNGPLNVVPVNSPQEAPKPTKADEIIAKLK
jgi:hypothetical protein